MKDPATPSAADARHPKSLCTVPWGNFQLGVNGAFRPCCIANLPPEAASVISDRLADAAQTTEDVNVRGQLDGIRRFLDEADPDPALLERFLTVTGRRDRIRGESFKDTFPELHDVLNGAHRTVWQRIRNRLGA